MSLSRTSASAPMSWATSAASRSLSPKRISCVATVSFSLTIGRIRRPSSRSIARCRIRAVHRVLEVAGGQQHLSGDDPEGAQGLLVAVDEHVLADRGRGLLRREIARTLREQEIRHPGRDRAGRHQHDLGAARVRGRECLDDRRDLVGVLPADRRRADLHDDATSTGESGAVEHAHSAGSSSIQVPAARRSASSSARARALASMRS